MPELLERRTWDLWEGDGSQDIIKLAEEKVLKMLEAKPTNRLSSHAEAEIDNIVRKAQVDCDGAGFE